MRRTLLVLLTIGLVGVAVVWSQPKTAKPEFSFATEKQNPVTHLKLNNAAEDFQFAIVSDRTGGHRAKVFAKAVDQLNLLQPEFVISVGDLIEGYTEDKTRLANEWREFQTYVSRLQMPFFYVPGNHDITNAKMATLWKEKFGRSYYEFVYQDTLFIALNSEDPPGKGSASFSQAQQDWLKQVLQDNKGVRWTLVFLHKPIWMLPGVEKSGWLEIEKLLDGRNYTVFAGHVHRYQKFVRQGMNYYMLATTGGISHLRGLEYGEFDHITWVTMKKEGPVIANVLLDGIHRENLAPFQNDEQGFPEYYQRPTYPASVTVTLNGPPLSGAYVTFVGTGKEPRQPRADGLSDETGRVRLSTYKANDGIPAGEYAVMVEKRQPFFLPDGKRGPNSLPAVYANQKTTTLKAEIKAGNKNEIELNLTSKGE